jgi:hypothetical protein
VRDNDILLVYALDVRELGGGDDHGEYYEDVGFERFYAAVERSAQRKC